jgi:predicted SnoaL-like aldol condensation-catalyzing enzyme
MSAEENKAMFRRLMEETAKGNFEIVDEMFSRTFRPHFPNVPDWPGGLEGARRMITPNAEFPDIDVTIEDILAEGEKVAIRWTTRGTYIGQAKPGFPTPGKPFTYSSINIYRFVDGKIEDDWGVEAFWKPWPV